MDDPIDTFDENGNLDLHFVVGPWSPEQAEFARNFHRELDMKPISPSYYEATSPSLEYVHRATDIISNLLYKRKTGLNDGDHKMVLVWDIGEIITSSCQQTLKLEN